jgi:hypothetical protein
MDAYRGAHWEPWSKVDSGADWLAAATAEFGASGIAAPAKFANDFNWPGLAPIQRLRAKGNATFRAEFEAGWIFLFTARANNCRWRWRS